MRTLLTVAVLFCSVKGLRATGGEVMPMAQQNALVHKYCAVCHSDAVRNGGLSLEHFDVANASPSLTAMLLSKLTSGVLMETAKAAASDTKAAALVDQKMKGGAMGAAGIGIPDKATIDALIHSFAVESAGATHWTVASGEGRAGVTASVLREVPTASPGEASFYRLVLSCNTATHEGDMQLAWSPSPRRGELSVAMDGNAPIDHKVDGSEKMGNGSAAITGPAAVYLFAKEAQGTPIVLPRQRLRVSKLFPDQAAEFSFDDLNSTARRALAACFSGVE